MDLFNEEIDFMLYESLEADGLIFEKRKRNLEDPELMKQIIDTVGMLPSSSRKIKKKEYIKQFGGGSWPKGLGKGAFILSLNKAGEARIYDIGSPDEAQDWSESGTEGAPKEEPEDAEDSRIIITPELTTGTGVRIIGGVRSVGDPIDTKILKFLEDKKLGISKGAAKTYAELIKNFSLAMVASEKSSSARTAVRMMAEQEEGENIEQELQKASIEKFNKWLKTRLDGIIDDAQKQQYVPGQKKSVDELVEESLRDTIDNLIKVNKQALKEPAVARFMTKNYSTSQQLAVKLATQLKRYLAVISTQPVEKEAPEEKQGEEPMQVATEPGKVELNEDKLVEIVIDFNEIRKNEMNESFLAMFGGWVEHILKAMFGGLNIPVNVRGSDREVQAFAAALGREKRYIDVAKRYGLDHASTYRSKAQLDTAAKNFHRETGIKWPFK